MASKGSELINMILLFLPISSYKEMHKREGEKERGEPKMRGENASRYSVQKEYENSEV